MTHAYPTKNTSTKNHTIIIPPMTILMPIPASVPTTEPTPEIAAWWVSRLANPISQTNAPNKGPTSRPKGMKNIPTTAPTSAPSAPQKPQVATEEVVRRVPHWVLRLLEQAARREKDGIHIDFPLSRQDVAELTGTTLHTVSRLFSAWESQGIVKGGRQKLLVRDRSRLEALAEGDGSGD